ncbi:MAG: Clp1/GlmU family protein [Anaerolineae bacterium]
MDSAFRAPQRWQDLDLDQLGHRIMILGATDTGKSTFARYLFHRFQDAGARVGFLDCDVGQSTIGLPTTLNLIVPAHGLPTAEGGAPFPPNPGAASFVGSISPRGHMLPLLVGCQRLLEKAAELAASVLIVDTTGLVDPAQGGVALKQWKIELLRPTTVVAFQRQEELEPILWPLRVAGNARVIAMPVSPDVSPRDPLVRARRRERLLQAYFAQARKAAFSLRQVPAFDLPRAAAGRLVALQDRGGYVLALGVVQTLDREQGILILHTPLADISPVCALRIGTAFLEAMSHRPPTSQNSERLRPIPPGRRVQREKPGAS